MDPLSITAAVVGLLTAAAKVNALLEGLSSVRNSPTTIKDVQNEVRHSEIALRAMQRLLHRLDAASPRREMIQVDDLRVALADAMLAFSEFQKMLERLAIRTRVRVAISWAKYSKQLDEHLQRIERYKSSLLFMLSILQCESDTEAHESQQKLRFLVDRVLAENTELRQRVSQSQDSFAARSIATPHPDNENNGQDGDDSSTIRGVSRKNTTISQPNTLGGRAIQFAFERILEQSRVYRKTDRYQECDRSFVSTAQRSRAWSVFSGYSLADISVLSVIAMPLTVMDVANGKYYVMERNDDNLDLTNPTSDNGAVPPAALVEGLTLPGNTLHDRSGTAPFNEVGGLNPAEQLPDDEIFPCKGCGEVSEY
ncbi:hypothetical protein F5144DRAFT_603745 [Chaetomium tenue]|uniref:Uncharacterized protein n=1 Tax=Chaetomium tenue TaxID=1854479 RepID=A0ACB7P0F0_9PEZI|nr:hypothetical protein F5144DRAFT_603745 [Chaetomium globosum]